MEITYASGSSSLLWPSDKISAYLLWGPEDLLKQEAEKLLVARFIDQDYADFDLEVTTADSTSAVSILGSVSQVPFGSPRRVVVVRGLEQWRDRGKQSEVERLAAGISGLTSPACLILVAAAEEDEQRRKTAVSAKLDAAIKEHGMMVVCRGLQGGEIRDWLADYVGNQGYSIERDAIDALIAAVGAEMRTLSQEVFKLVHYAGDRKSITTKDVQAIASTQSEDVMFQCVDAVSRRQADRALLLLGELHRHDPKPQAVAGRLLALLARQYRMLWQARHLFLGGVKARDLRSLTDEVTADLPSENSIAQVPYRAGEIMSAAETYSAQELKKAFDLLILCDLANKGGVTEENSLFSADAVTNLQLLVLQLTRRRSSV